MTKKQHITRERERELTIKAQAGDIEARNELVMAHYAFVVWMAGRYSNIGANTEEMVQNGLLGLMEAIMRSDVNRGTRLLTIAYWPIRRGILSAIADASLYTHDNAFKRPIRYSLDGAVPQEMRKMVSLDQVLSEEEMQTLGATIMDDKAIDPAEAAEESEVVDLAQRAMRKLKTRSRQIVHMRLGKGKKPGMSFCTIAEHFNISTERCRRIYLRAIRDIREGCDEEQAD